MTKMELSARAYGRSIKVTRTITVLTEQENIDTLQVAEAIQYRKLDRPIKVLKDQMRHIYKTGFKNFS